MLYLSDENFKDEMIEKDWCRTLSKSRIVKDK